MITDNGAPLLINVNSIVTVGAAPNRDDSMIRIAECSRSVLVRGAPHDIAERIRAAR